MEKWVWLSDEVLEERIVVIRYTGSLWRTLMGAFLKALLIL